MNQEDFSVIQPEILKQLAKQSMDRTRLDKGQEDTKSAKGEKVEIRIKFESRLHKDKFIAYFKAIKACRIVLLDQLLEKYHEVVNLNVSGLTGLNSVDQGDEQQIEMLEKMIEETKTSVARVVEMNKSVSDLNSNLEESVKLLEADLSQSLE